MQPKTRCFLFLLLSRSVHFFLKLTLYLFNSLFFLFFFWNVCQIVLDFIGHRDRSETHPAYLPMYSVKLSFMRISIYSIYIYIFFFFFVFLCIMNGLLQCMYVRCLIQDTGNIYEKKRRNKLKGVLWWCSDD